MFYSTESAISRINQELIRSGEETICRACFYKLRGIYCQIYMGNSVQWLPYDGATLLYLYYCAKAHRQICRYELLLLYMQRLDQDLVRKGKQFCDVYPSFSAINTHFLQAAPLVA